MWNSDWSHHAMYADGSWFSFWGMHGFVSLFFLLLVIALIIGLYRMIRSERSQDPALSALGEKYAKGEISRDDYLQKKKDLVG